jgi:hypothetical protein
MNFSKGIQNLLYFSVVAALFSSCQKVNVEFGASTLEADPNISFLANYKVDIATSKLDSFLTSSNEVLSLGYHYDSVFGVVKAGSYVQLKLPATNPLLNQTLAVTLDSLEMIIKPTGAFYGDSARPFKINVCRLSQNIANSSNAGDTYYNTGSFAYNSTPIGQQTVSLYGRSGTAIHIRLSDILGQELLTKFKDNNEDISTEERFINYFKGIYITTDSVVTNGLAYFSAPADSMIIRLNYHDNGLFPEKKYIDFNYTKEKQFNSLNFRHTNPNFAAFINKKMQLIPSTSSGNQSYLNTNLGSYIKFSFPTILNLKELHPYIRVVKAILIIKPDAKSFAYPYQLPKTLHLQTTNDDNYPISSIYSADNTSIQSGNLAIDYLFGENTNYSYDISGFINTLIAEGQFSKSALLLYPTLGDFSTGIERLILNDQNSSHSSVELKLYVLGL